MLQRGFTIVEVIITITIMGILMVVAVVNISGTQARARDDERKADVEAIASQLESYFKTGTDGSVNFNRYPTTNLVSSAALMKSTLRDIDPKSLTAPGISDPLQSFIAATNNIQTTAGVTPQPITINQYVYQPIKPDGSLCVTGDTDCRKFNIYYHLESDDMTYMITSKNQ